MTKKSVSDITTTASFGHQEIICCKCKEKKLLSDICASTIRKGGTGKCKACHKVQMAEYRANNKQKINALAATPYYVEARRIYQAGAGRVAANEASKRHRNAYPKRAKAKSMISHAIRDGKIVRPNSCETCGSDGTPQGHHCDYNRPMDVMWLCIKCHRKWHKENTPIY